MSDIPLDQDGVPLWGPMKEYVGRAMTEVGQAAYSEWIKNPVDGNNRFIDPRANIEKVKAAKNLAIAQWRAREAGIKDG